MDKFRIEYTAQVGRFGEKVREERQVVWSGTEERCLVYWENWRRMLTMELPGKRKWGRPKRRFMDAVRGEMTAVEVTEEDAEERTEWRRRIRCGDP